MDLDRVREVGEDFAVSLCSLQMSFRSERNPDLVAQLCRI